jgi:hypothetical protein
LVPPAVVDRVCADGVVDPGRPPRLLRVRRIRSHEHRAWQHRNRSSVEGEEERDDRWALPGSEREVDCQVVPSGQGASWFADTWACMAARRGHDDTARGVRAGGWPVGPMCRRAPAK